MLSPDLFGPRSSLADHPPALRVVRSLVALVVVALVAGDRAPGAGAAGAPRCRGRVATVVGTPGPDVLPGTPGRDVIQGLTGRDVVRGRRGDDLLCGGGGRDKVFGGRGADKADGGTGRDFVQVIDGRGGDRADGGPGEDDGCAIDVADRYRDCEAVVA